MSLCCWSEVSFFLVLTCSKILEREGVREEKERKGEKGGEKGGEKEKNKTVSIRGCFFPFVPYPLEGGVRKERERERKKRQKG